jgi:hypothetical protein
MARDLLNKNKLSETDEKIMKKILARDKYNVTICKKLTSIFEKYIDIDCAYLATIFTLISTVLSLVTPHTATYDAALVTITVPSYVPIVLLSNFVDFILLWIMNYLLFSYIIPNQYVKILIYALNKYL